MYDSKFLIAINLRAIELYTKSDVLPVEGLKQAMQEAGVPEDKLWETRQAIGMLGSKKQPQRRKMRKNPPKEFNALPITIDRKSLAAGER